MKPLDLCTITNAENATLYIVKHSKGHLTALMYMDTGISFPIEVETRILKIATTAQLNYKSNNETLQKYFNLKKEYEGNKARLEKVEASKVRLKNYSMHGARSSSFGDMRDQSTLALSMNDLLWDAFMAIDNGTGEEMEKALQQMESHFKKVHPPGAVKGGE